MGEITTIGVDLAKSVFQLHGVTADGTNARRLRIVIVRSRQRPIPAITIGARRGLMSASSVSSSCASSPDGLPLSWTRT
jgi:hypothetical protein